MRTSKNKKPRKLSAFERETERRRREMLGHLGARTSHLPSRLLKTYAATDATGVFRKLLRRPGPQRYLYGQKGREVYA